ncbi:uncharacterized protein [Melopsittacus undulatus]|uniref:uncharacterized protein n=1 Tax=Melopsittacus undulatus TaxID=13146 RepID=UPI00146ADC22|nr:uncharacterized protein LOC117436284 [Melopsittacus undulatus]
MLLLSARDPPEQDQRQSREDCWDEYLPSSPYVPEMGSSDSAQWAGGCEHGEQGLPEQRTVKRQMGHRWNAGPRRGPVQLSSGTIPGCSTCPCKKNTHHHQSLHASARWPPFLPTTSPTCFLPTHLGLVALLAPHCGHAASFYLSCIIFCFSTGMWSMGRLCLFSPQGLCFPGFSQLAPTCTQLCRSFPNNSLHPVGWNKPPFHTQTSMAASCIFFVLLLLRTPSHHEHKTSPCTWQSTHLDDAISHVSL